LCGVVQANPTCSKSDWCRHYVKIKNTSSFEVEIWCKETGCDGNNYYLSKLKPGNTFEGKPDAYNAKFSIAYESKYVHEFKKLDANGYCYIYNFEYKGSSKDCNDFHFNASSDKSICSGQSVKISAEGADYYQWSNGSHNRCITVSHHNIDNIKLNASIKSSTECILSWTKYSNVNYKLYARKKGDYDWYKFDVDDRTKVELYNLSPSTTYEWAVSMKCNNGKSSGMCNVHSFKTTGYGNGRMTKPTEIGINLSIDESYNPIQIHPNPATDLLKVYYDDLLVENLSVFNSSGKLVDKIKANQSGVATIKVKDYSNGIYIIILQSNDKLYKNLFIVE